MLQNAINSVAIVATNIHQNKPCKINIFHILLLREREDYVPRLNLNCNNNIVAKICLHYF